MTKNKLNEMSFDNCETSPLSSACEIIKDKFYFLTFQNGKLKSTSEVYYFCTDEQFIYRNYNQDFGPVNLAMVWRYCSLVNKKIETFQTFGRKLCHVTSEDPRKRTNAAFLVGCFSILLKGRTPEETVRCLITQPKVPLYLPFRDVSFGPSLYNLGLLDCFKAIAKARSIGIFDFFTFDVTQYEYLEKMVNGDINWIIPGKFLAFPGPLNKVYSDKGFPSHTPAFYIPYFIENNISTVVRLNKDLYDSTKFTESGISHHDIYFPDGSVPPISLVEKFLDICQKATGAVAVHCKAGLGRTGTMIGCYMMKNMKFSAAEAIAWMRISRPGSVIGMQQIFLNDIQKYLWLEGSKNKPDEGKQTSTTTKTTTTTSTTTNTTLSIHPSEIKSCIKPRCNMSDYFAPTRHSNSVRGLVHPHANRSLLKSQFSERHPFLSPLEATESKTITQGDILNQLKAKKQAYPKDSVTVPQNSVKLSVWTGKNTDPLCGLSEIEGVTNECFNGQSNLKPRKDNNNTRSRKTFESVQDIIKSKGLFPKRLFNNNNTTTRVLQPSNKLNLISKSPLISPHQNLPMVKVHRIRSSELSLKVNPRSSKLKLKTKDTMEPRPRLKKRLSKKVVNNENIISDHRVIKSSKNILQKIHPKQSKCSTGSNNIVRIHKKSIRKQVNNSRWRIDDDQ